MTTVDLTPATEPEVTAPRKRAPIPPAARSAIIDRLNRQYAVVLIGGSVAVLREGRDPDGRPEVRLLGLDAFREWTRPEKYYSPDGGKAVPVAGVWLNDDRRRQYAGLVFEPGERRVDPSHYNLWKGFAVQASRAGSCQRFLDHVAENVCDGDEARFLWVMGWFAALVQRPGQKLGTALALRGPMGVGKTILGEVIGGLLGVHYQKVSDPRFVTGRFNAHLANCLLLHLDEAVWAGDHTAAGRLKDIVTGADQMIEYKGKEPLRVRNFTRVFISSNEDWVVPAGLEERRFCILDVGTARLQDRAYFQAMIRELDEGGRARLMQYLLDFDTADLPLDTPLATAALREQQFSSLSPELAWWLDILMQGKLPGDREGTGWTPTKAIHSSYLDHTQRRGVTRRGSETQLGERLRRFVGEANTLVRAKRMMQTADGPARPWCYGFPPLAVCRAAFTRHLRGAPPWTADGDADWEAAS